MSTNTSKPTTDESDASTSRHPAYTLPSNQEQVVAHASQAFRGTSPAIALPSQLLAAHQIHQSAPTHLYTEDVPKAESDSSSSGSQHHAEGTSAYSNFAERANALINKNLGRTPDGMSIIDPDSVLDESGRLYHGYKDGKYMLPNDAAEQDRLDLQHCLFKLVLDHWLAIAPMERAPEYVLDVATGTGIWAIQFAERNPQSYVIGTDLSAIQPRPDVPNCSFQKDDAESEWVFRAPDNPYPVQFDYVHLRMVSSCFDDTREVMNQAFHNMKPGGWIEFQEIIFDTDVNTPMIRWYKAVCKGLQTMGRDLSRPKLYKTWLEEGGFINVQERSFVLPCNPWPKDKRLKEIGHFQMRNLFDGLKSVGWKSLRLAGMTAQEIEELVNQTKAYLQDPHNRPTAWILVVYGQKPPIQGAADPSP